MNKILKIAIKAFVGIAILYLLFYKIGWGGIWDALKNLNPWWFIVSLAFLFIHMLLNVVNLLLFVKRFNKPIGFWRMFKYYFMMLMVGLFVPGLFGQLSLIFFLKKEGLSYTESTSVALIDKALMFFIVLFFTSFSLFIFSNILNLTAITVILCFGFLLGIFIVFTNSGHDLVKIFMPKKIFSKIETLLKLFLGYKSNKRLLALNISIGFMKWIMRAFYYYFLFVSLGLWVPFVYVITISSIETLIAAIPISLSGLGLRESIGTLLYTQLGFSSSVVMAMYMLALITIYSMGLMSLPFINLDFKKENQNG